MLKLVDVTDAFVVEGVGTYLFDVLDVRGPVPDQAFERFCREAVEDPRAGVSLPGLASMALIADLGHPAVRARARAVLEAASDELSAELPSWRRHLGLVHVVEAGSLRTLDGRETIAHVLLDYDEPDAGSRHLLTIAVEHGEHRVHLLDVRGRGSEDSLAPVAEAYHGSEDPVWTWQDAVDLDALVGEAVRATSQRSVAAWPVSDVEGAPTSAWTLGVRRLEHVTGADLHV